MKPGQNSNGKCYNSFLLILFYLFLVISSIDDIYPSKKDSDSGVGSDNGDKRLSATEVSCMNFVFNCPSSTLISAIF